MGGPIRPSLIHKVASLIVLEIFDAKILWYRLLWLGLGQKASGPINMKGHGVN